MPEHMEQQDGDAHLRHLTKTVPDPRVRHRAQAVLLAPIELVVLALVRQQLVG